MSTAREYLQQYVTATDGTDAGPAPATARAVGSLEPEDTAPTARAGRRIGLPGGGALDRARDTIASMPTPVGLGAAIALLVFLWLVLYKVGRDGETRAGLMWLSLTGRREVDEGAAVEVAPEETDASTGGGNPKKPMSAPIVYEVPQEWRLH